MKPEEQAHVLEAATLEDWQPSDQPLLDWHQALRAGAAALRAAQQAEHLAGFHLCAKHQPEHWESDGTCPICEGHEQAERITALEQENAELKTLLSAWSRVETP